jgi:hypothetical protein
MGGTLWRYSTQEEGCTNHPFTQSFILSCCCWHWQRDRGRSSACLDGVVATRLAVDVGGPWGGGPLEASWPAE